MARKAVRDWITNGEAAKIIGVSTDYFFKVYCQRLPLPNSQNVGGLWLHYLPDVEKLKERRAKDPNILKYRKRVKPAKIKPVISEDGAGQDDANAVTDKPEEVKN